jgi:hypothetical protein
LSVDRPVPALPAALRHDRKIPYAATAAQPRKRTVTACRSSMFEACTGLRREAVTVTEAPAAAKVAITTVQKVPPCFSTLADTPPTTAAAGGVTGRATATRPAVPQRTPAGFLPVPAPGTPTGRTRVAESANPGWAWTSITVAETAVTMTTVTTATGERDVVHLPMEAIAGVRRENRRRRRRVPGSICSPDRRQTTSSSSTPSARDARVPLVAGEPD